MGGYLDDPNREAVGVEPAWVEGTGGEPGEPVAPDQPPEGGEGEGGAPSTADLDAMTKAQLLEYAQSIGVSPANNDMTKDEIRAGVDAKLAEG